MKLKLFLLCLLSGSLFYGQTVNIPDGNFKQALLDFTPTDVNSDGEIQVSEALAVDTLIIGDNWASYGIQDLTGIAYFTNLVYLDCHNNQIASLDLSQNINLEVLNCSNNQLVSLILSDNLQLKTLDCTHNQISSLDLSHNTVLESLSLGWNQLNSLNVINNIQLSILGLNNNLLISINLNQNNNLQLIGVQNNPELNFIDLRNGNNGNLEYFNATNNPDLTCIFVDDKIYSQNTWQDIDPNSNFVETQQECDDLGLGSNKKLNIKVYPNPVKNKLFIEAENKSNLHYTLYSLTGKQLKQGEMFPVNMQDQATGIYFIQLTQNHQSHTYKIIKEY